MGGAEPRAAARAWRAPRIFPAVSTVASSLPVGLTCGAVVACSVTLAEELRAGCRQRYIAEFVDDQQLVGRQLTLEAEQSLLVSGLDQLVDHSGRGSEADRQTFLTGGEPQSESNVRLPGAAVADSDRILLASNVFAASEFQDQCLVQRRDHREVEAVEAFHRREPCLPDAATIRRSRSISSSSAKRSK